MNVVLPILVVAIVIGAVACVVVWTFITSLNYQTRRIEELLAQAIAQTAAIAVLDRKVSDSDEARTALVEEVSSLKAQISKLELEITSLKEKSSLDSSKITELLIRLAGPADPGQPTVESAAADARSDAPKGKGP